jgi:Ca2+-binding EF-hand superfamily protein
MQERIKSGPGEIFRAFKEFRRAARSADNEINEIEFIQCLKHVGVIKKTGENGLARRVFRAIDTSKNGRIDFNEFVKNVLGSKVEDYTRLPSRENEDNAKRLKHLKKQVAPNVHRDKVIEVLRSKLKQKTKGGAAMLLRSFKQFRTLSRSSDNLIDLSEFKTLLAHLGFRLPHEEAKRVFDIIDGDKNGSIDLEDFTRTLFDDCRTCGSSARREDVKHRTDTPPVKYVNAFEALRTLRRKIEVRILSLSFLGLEILLTQSLTYTHTRPTTMITGKNCGRTRIIASTVQRVSISITILEQHNHIR